MKSYVKSEYQNYWNCIFIWRDLMLVHGDSCWFGFFSFCCISAMSVTANSCFLKAFYKDFSCASDLLNKTISSEQTQRDLFKGYRLRMTPLCSRRNWSSHLTSFICKHRIFKHVNIPKYKFFHAVCCMVLLFLEVVLMSSQVLISSNVFCSFVLKCSAKESNWWYSLSTKRTQNDDVETVIQLCKCLLHRKLLRFLVVVLLCEWIIFIYLLQITWPPGIKNSFSSCRWGISCMFCFLTILKCIVVLMFNKNYWDCFTVPASSNFCPPLLTKIHTSVVSQPPKEYYHHSLSVNPYHSQLVKCMKEKPTIC